jgi:hypothetical protein
MFRRLFVGVFIALTAVAHNLRAQTMDTLANAPVVAFVGSELENYLRVLQTVGVVPLYPWSIRGFSADEVRRLGPRNANHPRAASAEFRSAPPRGSLQWQILPVQVAARYNSAFPYGSNDGAIWAGRGLTSSIDLGAAVRWGPVSLVVAPTVFRAENTAFPLSPNGWTDTLRYGDPDWPTHVDRPQRFGDRPYRRVDLGQTTLRFDWRIAAFGISTANQWLGPMIEYPYLLGNNAPGFPHVFVGTSHALNVGIGRLHGRIFSGQLVQSDYTGIPTSESKRLASGIAIVFTPRWLSGLELGTARFVHAPWPADGPGSSDLRKLLEGLVIRRDARSPTGFAESDTTNQLASIFVRWALPKSGFEVYGEFGRDDHGWDSRDVLLEVDHSSSLGLGFRKAWLRGREGILALRGEILDFRLPVLWRHRGEGGTYIHPIIRHGHTHRGQMLGAGFGVSSSQALTLELDHRSAAGGARASWSSAVRREGTAPGMVPDIQHVVGLEKSVTSGALEIALGVGGIYEFNRDFARDARDYYGTLRIRWWPYLRAQ